MPVGMLWGQHHLHVALTAVPQGRAGDNAELLRDEALGRGPDPAAGAFPHQHLSGRIKARVGCRLAAGGSFHQRVLLCLGAACRNEVVIVRVRGVVVVAVVAVVAVVVIIIIIISGCDALHPLGMLNLVTSPILSWHAGGTPKPSPICPAQGMPRASQCSKKMLVMSRLLLMRPCR